MAFKQFSDRAYACPSCGMHTEDILYETNENYRDQVEIAEEAYQSVDTIYNTLGMLGLVAVIAVGAMWVLQPSMDSTFARFLMFGGAALVSITMVLKRLAENRIADQLARHLNTPKPQAQNNS